jgi:dTDP-4-amino-4,6-dideoxygalactose transaminase
MGTSENGSLARCASVSFPKTSPLQTAKGFFVVAPDHHYSLKTENETHLKNHGKQEPLCAMRMDEYKLVTSTQQFAFEK